jgi:hypothetical protein
MLRIEPRLAFINVFLLANRVLIFRFQLLAVRVAVYVLLVHNCGECRIGFSEKIIFFSIFARFSRESVRVGASRRESVRVGASRRESARVGASQLKSDFFKNKFPFFNFQSFIVTLIVVKVA